MERKHSVYILLVPLVPDSWVYGIAHQCPISFGLSMFISCVSYDCVCAVWVYPIESVQLDKTQHTTAPSYSVIGILSCTFQVEYLPGLVYLFGSPFGVLFCSVVLGSFGHSLVTCSLMHTNTHVSRRTLTSKMLHKTNLQVFLWFSEYSCRYVVILIISALWIYANVFVYVYKYSPMYSTLRGKRLINKFVAQHLWIGCLHVCVCGSAIPADIFFTRFILGNTQNRQYVWLFFCL